MNRAPAPQRLRKRVAVHVAIFVFGAAVLRLAAVPAEICPPVTADQVDAAIDGAAQWLVGGMAADGTYTYGFDRDTEAVNGSYNHARHAGVTMSLYQLAAARDDPTVLAAADMALDHALGETVTDGDWMAWRPGGDIPVGANGLLLAALALRRRHTGDDRHDDVMRGMGRFLLGQQQADGSVYAYWDVTRDEPEEVYGPFATGEAAWALALLDEAFPGEGWGEAAATTVAYMAQDRNEKEGYFTSLPDHWAAYTLAELHPSLVDADSVDYARRLAGFFGIRLRFEAQRRGSGLNLWLRWYPGPPAGVGTAGEGIGALHRLSKADDRLGDSTNAIESRLVCMAGFMVERQLSTEDAVTTRPSLEAGAWFYRGYTQMDDQQHVLSALLAAVPVLREREGEA